ncbi:lysosomal alpha-mannosidase-like protein [Trifolium pratense]|uniref:Uncharacterized protein n=2 Tax=Trifolium pratense TaxID=57577 RepID=A0ACB0JIN7_TRIPR|nr:lysosomal alpha-mannosidase-like protein [Trifolium pratense]CAJ2644984.1 unnamed protein product [Trifolium pratense]
MFMHDEATLQYTDLFDQTTLGHQFIKDEFHKIPRVVWQIDPFGHSAVHAYFLGAEVLLQVWTCGETSRRNKERSCFGGRR